MKRKFMSLILTLAMICSMFIPAMAAETTQTDKIVILHTNDVHCEIDQVKDKDSGAITNIGYAGVAAYKAKMETAYGTGNVTLVDAGDAIQGGPIGTLSKGSYIVDIMNQVGYDIAVPGNHEFDYGMDNFLSLAKDTAKFPYLCANFTDTAGKSVLDAYKVITYGDTKVAYVGIDTPEAFTKSTPTYFQDANGKYIYGFSEGNEGKDLYANVQKAVDAAKKEGAQYVVAVGHLGIDTQSSPWMSTELVANTTGIDVFIDGHSHSTYDNTAKNKDGKEVVMAQTGTKLSAIGKIVIDTKTGAITHELVKGYAQQESATADFIKNINDEFDGVLKKVVAKTDVTLTVNNPATGKRAVRSAETNLGDLCADAYRTMLGADIAFVNGGGVRADIKAGEITYEDIIKVHPFGNEACMIETTGQKILDALEMGAKDAPNENGGFLQVSGITYTIDTSMASKVILNDKKEFVKVDGDYRVKDVMVGGKPLDITKTYTLASHNYMLKSGGDGFVMFKGEKLLKDCVMIDNQVLINYIVEKLGGVVTKDYENPMGQGRIVIKYLGVEPGAWYVDAAKYVMDGALMTSTGKGFDPNGVVTRGTVFQTLYNMEGKPAVGATSFTDVSGKWYADAAAWAEAFGIATVPADKLFNGDRNITRAEIATIFAGYAAAKGMTIKAADLSTYADAADVAAWAKDYMMVAVGSGILTGKNGNRLAPNETAVRAELAKILMNYGALKLAYTVENVEIKVPAANGIPAHTMAATVTIPTGEGKFPAVVMLHGTGSNKDEAGGGYAMAAPQMAREGIATIRIDFMGTNKAEEYKYYNYTSANLDAKAAADYMAKLANVDGNKLGVMGWSQGGTNALLAAAKYPATFKTVVTWSGAVDLTGLFAPVATFEEAYAIAQKDGFYTMKLDWRTPSELPVGKQWFDEVKATDVLAEFAKVNTPVLAINGDKDDVVLPENAVAIKKAATNPASSAWMVDNADHTYNVFTGDYTAINDAIAQTIAFFNKNLNSAGTQAKELAA